MAKVNDITCSENSGCYESDSESFLKEEDISKTTESFNKLDDSSKIGENELKPELSSGLSETSLVIEDRAPLYELAMELKDRITRSEIALEDVKNKIAPEGHKHMQAELDEYVTKKDVGAETQYEKKLAAYRDAMKAYNENKEGRVISRDDDGNITDSYPELAIPEMSTKALPPALSTTGNYAPGIIDDVNNAYNEAKAFKENPLDKANNEKSKITVEKDPDVVTNVSVFRSGGNTPGGSTAVESTDTRVKADGTYDTQDREKLPDKTANDKTYATYIEQKQHGGINKEGTTQYEDGTKGHYKRYLDGTTVVSVKNGAGDYTFYRYNPEGKLIGVEHATYVVDADTGKTLWDKEQISSEKYNANGKPNK